MQAMKFPCSVLVVLSVVVLTLVSACSEKTPEQIAAENKKRSELSIRRSQVLLFEDKAGEAVAMLEKTRKVCGDFPDLCEALAYAYIQDKQPALSAMYFEKASDIDGGNADLLILAAKTYEQAGSPSAAVNAYTKYLKIKPKDSVAWKSLASCFERLNRYQDALNSWMSAIKTSSKNPTATEAAALGSLFVKLGNAVQAKRWFEAALESEGSKTYDDRKISLLGLASIYLSQKDVAKLELVVADLDKMDRTIIDKNYPALRSQLADFRQKLAEAQAALRIEAKRKKDEESKKLEPRTPRVPEKGYASEIPVAHSKKSESLADEPDEGRMQPRSEQDPKMFSGNGEKKPTVAVSDGSSTSSTVALPNAERAGVETGKEMPLPPPVADDPFSPPVDGTVEYTAGSSEPFTPVEKYIRRSRERLMKGDVNGAEKSAHLAVFENRKSPQAWRALAQSYEAQKRNGDSYLAAREAYMLNPDDINATLFYLRNASRVLNNEKFLNVLYAAREKFPDNAEILVGLARTYKTIGDARNAKFFYKEFVDRTPKEHRLYKKVYEEYEELLRN